jgi:hypothetical protein
MHRSRRVVTAVFILGVIGLCVPAPARADLDTRTCEAQYVFVASEQGWEQRYEESFWVVATKRTPNAARRLARSRIEACVREAIRTSGVERRPDACNSYFPTDGMEGAYDVREYPFTGLNYGGVRDIVCPDAQAAGLTPASAYLDST